MYLYSNAVGVFLYDRNANQVKRTVFKDSIDYSKKLAEGEFLNEELNIVKTVKNDDIVVLTTKKELLLPNLKKFDPKNEFHTKTFDKILFALKKEKAYKKYIQVNMDIIADKLRNNSPKDMIIIQAINNIDDTERVINTLSTRLREWYSLYNPELHRQIEDHKSYAKALLDAKKTEDSIGADFPKADMKPIFKLANQVITIYDYKESQQEYLEGFIKEVCPNVAALATEMIAARLFALAGSLRKLALYPASTIQTLGAEKAMFRHLKTGDRPPKHGVIVLHPLVNKAKRPMKGKVARALGAKIALAAKIDYFGGDDYKGYEMREELEKKFGSY